MRRKRSYVGLREDSLVARVLVRYFRAAFFVFEGAPDRRGDEARSARREDAARFVQRLWGPSPDLSLRYEFRRMLHAQLLGIFFVGGTAAGLLVAVARLTGAGWVEVLARAVMLTSCVALGAHGPVAVRMFATIADAYAWEGAGRPETWSPRAFSQPRASDLVWATLLSLSWMWFFWQLLTT